MKRRVLAGLLASVLALGTLAGCGGGGSDDAATDSSAEATTDDASAEDGSSDAEGGDLGEITMILALRDEFLSTLEAGALAAAEDMGITLTTQDAQSDTSKECRPEGNHCQHGRPGDSSPGYRSSR